MNKSKILTAFSVGILVLALVAFVGLVFVLPSLEAPGETPHEASIVPQNLASSDLSSPMPTDSSDQSADQSFLPPGMPTQSIPRTPITAGNVNQLVELAALQIQDDMGTDIAFYPPYPLLFVAGITSDNVRGYPHALICEANTFQVLNEKVDFTMPLQFSPDDGRKLYYVPNVTQEKEFWILPSIHDPSLSWGGTLRGHGNGIKDATFNADGTRVVSGSMDNTLRIWNAWNGRQLLQVDFASGVNSVAYGPDDALIAAGLTNGEIHLLDAESGDEIAAFKEHTSAIDHLAFSPDGRWLASASRDTTLNLWDLQSLSLSRVLEGHVGQITDLAFSADGSLLASSSKDATVRLWDPATGAVLWQYGEGKLSATSAEWMVALDFSPDGGLLAFLTGGGVGHVWGLPLSD